MRAIYIYLLKVISPFANTLRRFKYSNYTPWSQKKNTTSREAIYLLPTQFYCSKACTYISNSRKQVCDLNAILCKFVELVIFATCRLCPSRDEITEIFTVSEYVEASYSYPCTIKGFISQKRSRILLLHLCIKL